MGRREDRVRRKLEKDPAMECNKVRQKYCPDLFRDFADTKDPRNPQLYGLFQQGAAGYRVL